MWCRLLACFVPVPRPGSQVENVDGTIIMQGFSHCVLPLRIRPKFRESRLYPVARVNIFAPRMYCWFAQQRVTGGMPPLNARRMLCTTRSEFFDLHPRRRHFGHFARLRDPIQEISATLIIFSSIFKSALMSNAS